MADRAIRRSGGEAGGLSWRLARRPSHPLLRDRVSYCGYEERSVGRVRRREPAQDRVTVIIGFGEPMTIAGSERPAQRRRSFVAPVSDAWASCEFEGSSRGIQIDLAPDLAHTVFGLPMHQLSDLVVPLEDLLGSSAELLAERLEGAAGWEERFQILDGMLCRRRLEGPELSPDVAYAWSRIVSSGGQARVRELTGELGCSRRHLLSRFREQIGPAPKTAGRIVRFCRVRRALTEGPALGLAALAAEHGYYDQAHMSRDVVELAGISPAALRSSALEPSLGLIA